MTARHVIDALHVEGLDPVPHWVLVVLANYANEDGYAWPTPKTLAYRTGFHVSTIRRALLKLQDRGYVKIKGGKTGGKGVSYALLAGKQKVQRAPDARSLHPVRRSTHKEIQERGDARSAKRTPPRSVDDAAPITFDPVEGCPDCGGTGWRQVDLPRLTVVACHCRVIGLEHHARRPPAPNQSEAP
jgi:hypothetical protein